MGFLLDAATPRPEADAVAPQSSDYWGNAPGLDWGDVIPFIGERGSVFGHALAPPLEVLGSGARGVRTLLGTGDPWEALKASIPFTDAADKATSAADLRKQYLGGGFTEDHPGAGLWDSIKNMDLGRLGNEAIDFSTNVATDPLMWTHPGLSTEGLAAKSAAVEAKNALLRLAPENTAARAAVISRYEAATGKAFPAFEDASGLKNFTGNEATLGARRAAGEANVRFESPLPGFIAERLPAIPVLTRPLETSNKAAMLLGDAINPIQRIGQGMGAAAGLGEQALELTAPGRAALEYGGRFKDWITDPSTTSAFGLGRRQAAIIVKNAVDPLTNEAKQAYEGLAASGLPPEQWDLGRKMVRNLDPREAVPTGPAGDVESELKRIGAGPSKWDDAKDIAARLQALPDSQVAALYEFRNKMHGLNQKARQIAGDMVRPTKDILGAQKALEEFDAAHPEANAPTAPPPADRYPLLDQSPEVAKQHEFLSAQREVLVKKLEQYKAEHAGALQQEGDAILQRPAKLQAEYDAALKKAFDEQGKSEFGGKMAEEIAQQPEFLKLKEQIDRAKGLANDVPNYFPRIGSREGALATSETLDTASGVGKKAAGAGTEAEFAHYGKNEYEGQLEGLPMSEEAAEARYKAGAGTAATHGKKIFEPLIQDAKSAFQFVKGMFTKEGTEGLQKEADLYVQDSAQAYEKYLTGKLTRTLNNTALKQNIENVFHAIPASAWKEAVIKAQAGESLDDIKAFFKEASGGLDITELRPELKTSSSIKEILTENSQPQGWSNAYGEQTHYLPEGAVQAYNKALDSGTIRLGDTLAKLSAPVAGLMAIWKKAQTTYWPSFHLRNGIGDFFRGLQGEVIDGETLKDMAGLMGGRSLDELRNGYGDFSAFGKSAHNVILDDQAAQILGRAAGPAQISGQEAMQLAHSQGALNTGYTAELLRGAADKANKAGLAAQGIEMAGRPVEYMSRMSVLREDVQRAAGIMARLRAGDSLLEAGLRTEKSYFNFGSLSPAADFLRKTGLAPFVSWQAKNIPFQLQFALENPGKFSAMVHGVQQLQGMNPGGEKIPEDLFPKYMQDKFGIEVSQGKDDKGRPVLNYATASGLLPISDLMELAQKPSGYLQQVLGPLPKVAAEWLTGDLDEEKGVGGKLAKSLIGKPFQVGEKAYNAGQADTRTGMMSPGLASIIGENISPLKVSSLQMEAAVKSADSKLKSEVNAAKGAVNRANWALNEAHVTYGDQDPSIFANAEQALQQAQIAYKRAQQRAANETAQNDKTLRRVRAYQAAP